MDFLVPVTDPWKELRKNVSGDEEHFSGQSYLKSKKMYYY